MGGRILVIDDEADMLRLMQRIIGEDTRHEAVCTADPRDGLDRLRNREFDLVITDLRMPHLDGIQVLEAAQRIRPGVPVIILTAYATIETAVEAVRKGAYDYLTKPFRRERLLLTLEKVLAWRKMLRENAELRRALSGQAEEAIVGATPVMQAILDQARQVGSTMATVLITGPSGSGKELLARSVHRHSQRGDHKLVTINCAAMPEQVLESELFGHVKGAFTGAWKDKRGLVEEAEGGTLFLDEIGDLSPLLQTKLLRLLQEGEYRPIGSVVTRRADLRFIAATHHDLKADIRAQTFREDLYYRLRVVHLELPPLRDRREDIPLLAQHFLRKHARRHGKPVTRISPAAVQTLLQHDYPGNVRELENAIERAVVFCGGDTLGLNDLGLEEDRPYLDLPLEDAADLGFREARERALRLFHRQYIATLLRETAGNVSRAAERAGIQRQYLHRLMKEAEIDAADFKPPRE
jgi:DNA-binding NtrC family response regulator